MNRRHFLTAAGLGAARAAFGARKRPNILVLFTDDQRFNTVNALNNPEVKTPTMDRLVRQGTAFTHACIMGGTIGAVCAPSRAMLMTGQTLFHIDRSIIRPERRAGKPAPAVRDVPRVLPARGLHHLRHRQVAQRRKTLRALLRPRREHLLRRHVGPLEGSRRRFRSERRVPQGQAPHRREVFHRTLQRLRHQVPARVPRRQAVPGLRRLHLAARPAHGAEGVRGHVLAGEDLAAAELHARAPVRQRRDEDSRRGTGAPCRARRRSYASTSPPTTP